MPDFFCGFDEPDFFDAGSLLAVNGGMMSEPLSADATAVGFGGSAGVVALSGDGSGLLDPDPEFAATSEVGAFASGLLPPHAAVSANSTEKPAAARLRGTENRMASTTSV